MFKKTLPTSTFLTQMGELKVTNLGLICNCNYVRLVEPGALLHIKLKVEEQVLISWFSSCFILYTTPY